jgi:hypothetical protein
MRIEKRKLSILQSIIQGKNQGKRGSARTKKDLLAAELEGVIWESIQRTVQKRNNKVKKALLKLCKIANCVCQNYHNK